MNWRSSLLNRDHSLGTQIRPDSNLTRYIDSQNQPLSYKLTNPETLPLLYTCVHVCVYIYPFRTTSFSILSLIVPLLVLEYHGRGYVQRCS